MAIAGKANGRPKQWVYTDEIGQRIYELILSGRSLKSIAESEEGIPTLTVLVKWTFEIPDFNALYDKARERRADLLFEEVLEISDNGTNDWMAKNDPNNPGYAVNGEYVGRSRLRVDSRKWAAAKLNPKKYGDKIEHSTDPERPIGLGAIIVPAKDLLEHLTRNAHSNGNGNAKQLEYYTHDDGKRNSKRKKK